MNRQKFYKSKQWYQCRGSFVKSKNYLCERCGRVCWTKGDNRYKNLKAEGHDVVFGIVHHKIYLTDANVHDPEMTLNWKNLEYLCITCHNKEHSTRTNEVRKDVSFDEYGNLVRR